MLFVRNLHYFCLLSYLNVPKAITCNNFQKILKNLNSELETQFFFQNVVRSLLNTAMQLEMLHRFLIFQKNAFLLISGSKNHGFLENVLPSILDKIAR